MPDLQTVISLVIVTWAAACLVMRLRSPGTGCASCPQKQGGCGSTQANLVQLDLGVEDNPVSQKASQL